jgi:hypothetical protein
MMSSAIPARLQFQCGHAAIVTLPRIKGESTAQRNLRIAQEKSAALARQCDFCGPTVEVSVPMNGTHIAADMADILAAEAVAVVLPPEPTVVTADVAVEFEVEAFARADSSFQPEPLPADVLGEPAEMEALIEVDGLDLVEVLEVASELAAASEPVVSQPTHTNGNGVTHPKPTRRRQPAESAPVARARQFLVEYRVERVLQAADVRDALRQAVALGATEVRSITREH